MHQLQFKAEAMFDHQKRVTRQLVSDRARQAARQL
jgi:hypothetical protein